jgi:glycogen(starch) synthase
VPRLLILAASEVTRDPRARRAALAAVARGYDVTAICPATPVPPVVLDGITVVRIAPERVAPSLNRLGLGGMQRRQNAFVRELRGLYRLIRLVRATFLLVRAAHQQESFGIVHANEIDTLPAAWLIRRRFARHLVYDAHEIYTSAEPDPPRLHRAVTRLLERFVARRSEAVVTVSEPIADELGTLLRLPRRPFVTLNCPHVVEQVDLRPAEGKLRAIYQGAMGPGRPLDDLLDAAHSAPHTHIAIRVTNADLADLRREVERRDLGDRVTVLDPVSPLELVESLTGFEAGLIFNRPVSRNDEFVFPNKLFEYMMAGLAVVAPALPSLASFISEHGIGLTFPPGNAVEMGRVLESLAADRVTVAEMRQRARSLALECFNAESQERILADVWARAT